MNSASKGGATALMIASERGEFEFVKLLIEHQADMNAKSRNGTTPVFSAAAGGMKILLPIYLIKVQNFTQ